MSEKTLVTTYRDLDIDGFASITGLVDFYKEKDDKLIPAYYGDYTTETKFVADSLKDELPQTDVYEPKDFSSIILVDTSNPRSVEKEMDNKKIKKIIDHRIEIGENDYPWAEKQIELVGSCATLITEMFQKEGIRPNKKLATYLYAAIVSNTVNFKNKVTTKRDIDAAEYLKKLIDIPENFVKLMFQAKSDLSGSKLKYHLEHDYKEQSIAGKNFTIFQIEITDIDQLVEQRLNEISTIVNTIVDGHNLKYYFLNCIDIWENYNLIIVFNEATKALLEEVLSIRFDGNVAKTQHIVMRKEIMAKIKEYLEKVKYENRNLW